MEEMFSTRSMPRCYEQDQVSYKILYKYKHGIENDGLCTDMKQWMQEHNQLRHIDVWQIVQVDR
jgi:hypothetical protein